MRPDFARFCKIKSEYPNFKKKRLPFGSLFFLS